MACTRGPVWSSAWERETGEAGRKETHLRNSSSARVGVFRDEENVIVSLELPSSRVSTFITTDYYPTRSLPVSPDFIIQFAGAIFIARIVLCPRVERVGGGGRNLFPAGKSFVVRITGLRVEKSVAQRVVQASTRHIPSRGRLARHRKRFWPKTAPRIPTSSAPVIGPDRENKDSHGHNRGSTSGYGPVPYSYEHSATPAPPIYPASYPCTLRTLVE